MTTKRYSSLVPAAELQPRSALNSYAPEFKPELWNDDSMARFSRQPNIFLTGIEVKSYDGGLIPVPNCYAYATNAPLLQTPGASLSPVPPGLLPPAPSARETNHALVEAKYIRQTVAGAERNGLKFVGTRPLKSPNTYLIAFYVAPRNTKAVDDSGAADYHFVRQDRDGGWSHKPGAYAPRATDSAGNKITDPRTADIRLSDGRPYKFVGYFLAPAQGIDPQHQGKFGAERASPDPPPYLGQKLAPHEMLVFRMKRPSDGFNFYLQRDAAGNWMHAPGYAAPTNRDDRGQIITDPQKAYFEHYDHKSKTTHQYERDGYFIAQNGDPFSTAQKNIRTLDVQSERQASDKPVTTGAAAVTRYEPFSPKSVSPSRY